jgi:hypothetical protein
MWGNASDLPALSAEASTVPIVRLGEMQLTSVFTTTYTRGFGTLDELWMAFSAILRNRLPRVIRNDARRPNLRETSTWTS